MNLEDTTSKLESQSHQLIPELSIIKTEPFRSYADLFIQRTPHYAVKTGRSWVTKKKALSDIPIAAHLLGKYAVATYGKWYPEFCILDIDNRPRGTVDEIRDQLSLDEKNSMLFESESAESYHLLIKPECREKPPTIRLLNNALRGFCDTHKIEVYPQATRAIRLPFGPRQGALDFEYMGLKSWEDKLYWFQKLNDFDITGVKGQQLNFDFVTVQRPGFPSIMEEAAYLYQNGLQCPSSRHDGQFKVLYSLWRQNTAREAATAITYGWISKKHNGFSKDILRYPLAVKREIERQAHSIYSRYELARAYPDSTHNLFNGFISKPDIERIIQVGQGSLPRMRFLFHLVKFYYPRRFRTFVSVHRDRLVEWASNRTYDKYLNELDEKGIVKRGKAYQPGVFSKAIKLEWPFKNSSEAVLYDGRSIDTFEQTAKTVFKPTDLRELVENAGTSYRHSNRIVAEIFRT